MSKLITTKYYILENSDLLSEAKAHLSKQEEILKAFRDFKIEHGADYLQFRDSINQGICFNGLCYLESNVDKIDKEKFKVSKPFITSDEQGNEINVVRAVARSKFKEGLHIEGMRYSYNNFCKILVAQGYMVNMVALADHSAIYFEVKGVAVDGPREILGSEYEAKYNTYIKEISG